MNTRSPWLEYLLVVLTFGIYLIVWMRRTIMLLEFMGSFPARSARRFTRTVALLLGAFAVSAVVARLTASSGSEADPLLGARLAAIIIAMATALFWVVYLVRMGSAVGSAIRNQEKQQGVSKTCSARLSAVLTVAWALVVPYLQSHINLLVARSQVNM